MRILIHIQKVVKFIDILISNFLYNSEDTSSSLILYIAIVILLITIIVLVVSMIIIFNKKTNKQVIQVKQSPVAQNRYARLFYNKYINNHA